jgi:REP-associated tyrosine transposase
MASRTLPSLRRDGIFMAVRAAFAKASTERFRLLQFSVQRDHVHLILEGDGLRELCRGIQGLAIRVAKAINRALGRHGRVWDDRYHLRALPTPREVRHALLYVLQNWRKHLNAVRGLDPRSSAAWFTGWHVSTAPPPGRPPVAPPRTWLASVGWRRHGLIGVAEAPRPRPLRR